LKAAKKAALCRIATELPVEGGLAEVEVLTHAGPHSIVVYRKRAKLPPVRRLSREEAFVFGRWNELPDDIEGVLSKGFPVKKDE